MFGQDTGRPVCPWRRHVDILLSYRLWLKRHGEQRQNSSSSWTIITHIVIAYGNSPLS